MYRKPIFRSLAALVLIPALLLSLNACGKQARTDAAPAEQAAVSSVSIPVDLPAETGPAQSEAPSSLPEDPERSAAPVPSEPAPSSEAPPAPEAPSPSEAPAASEAPEASETPTDPPTVPPSSEEEPPSPATEPSEEPAPAEDESWKLILVNADHPLPEGFTVRLKALRNGQNVDERIYPELQQMFDDARAQDIYPYINESFRTAERQQEIMDKYIANYEAQGMSHEAAVEKALSIVALPGTSEHQLGLALDIIAEYSGDSTATWQWLKENCWRYGFILRYPADKEDITGISYEPWHFRYVGIDAAKEIMERGVCLEEYLSD